MKEVESEIGRLALHDFMDCPPYSELLIQGFFGVAVRHPEYHLVRDLALLYKLFRDAEADLEEKTRKGGGSTLSTELQQSVARIVILACFNLLEAFVSGLATAWLMEHPSPTPDQIKHTADATLRKRLLNITRLVTGRSDLFAENKPPFGPLFGELKQRRDSFVHCIPGEEPSKWGYVKEALFHDVPAFAVEQTVDCTEALICETWKALTGRERPTWFPRRLPDGLFKNMEVSLVIKPDLGVAERSLQ